MKNISTWKDDPEVEEMMMECWAHTDVMARTFFPEHFFAPFNELHDQIIGAVDGGERIKKKVVIAAPRGLGKTSIAGLAYAAKSLLFRDSHYLVYASSTATKAEEQTDNLRRELITNVDVRKAFGNIKTDFVDTKDFEEGFSKKAWTMFGGTRVLPRGAGQQIRGLLFQNKRPDLIIFDDLEDDDTIDNEEIRKKTKHWFDNSAMNCFSRYSPNWAAIYIDTLKHEDSLLAELLVRPDWTHVHLSAFEFKREDTGKVDENNHKIFKESIKSLAPSFMTDEELEQEMAQAESSGNLDGFFRELGNIPVSAKDQSFRQEYFQHYNEGELQEEINSGKRFVECMVLADLARSEKPQATESAAVGLGIDTENQCWYVRDIVHGRFFPDDFIREMFDMADRLGARVVAYEKTGLGNWATYPIKSEMSKRGKYYELVDLGAGGRKKEKRIASLMPFYRQGHVYHNAACCKTLEQQLMSFPRPKYWDVMDALAYAPDVLEQGLRYFEPKFEKARSAKDVEEEYAELMSEYEAPLNWGGTQVGGKVMAG